MEYLDLKYHSINSENKLLQILKTNTSIKDYNIAILYIARWK